MVRFLGIRSHRTPPAGSRGEDGLVRSAEAARGPVGSRGGDGLVRSAEAAQGPVERDLGGYGGGDGPIRVMCHTRHTCRPC